MALQKNTARAVPEAQKVFEEIGQIIRCRELLKNLVMRDIKVRYRRSILGFVWMMLNPLLMMLVLSMVFSQVFREATRNYTVYLLSGIIMWNFFSQSTSMTVRSFLDNGNLIRKIYVPKSVFLLSTLLSASINFLLSLVPLSVILIVTGTPLSSQCYLIPVVIVLVFFFSLGLSLITSTITVFFHDMIHIYEVILLAWMYATPVIYPESIIPERFQILLHLNPFYYFLSLFRGGLYMDLPSAFPYFLYALAFSIISLLVGSAIYARYKDRVVYYL